MKFNGICLITEDVSYMAAFYKEILQAEVVGDENNARILIEDSHIDIFSKQGMENMAPGSTLNAGYGSYTIEIEVDDVDEEFKLLNNKNVTFVKRPETYPWGRRSFWFRDPDGNIINFYSKQ
ncbi:Uncharacterized conserved protein PhnB, glyoxalase superfamily [Paenibacillus uliginis N3/975]|uniref:Uncharacterized conserved protein PhnB, glyoxalase superfamily n=1 Tax=Paenibacillus uliginis N3/975 TaxID=1313296 RepID=A0A1X7H3Z5_9BACL|nr:VOC family protein [Paenibacillus uliginis]SMF79162.1 Uncharacterized conserved protein PhnB, glyoxalase superfamily [Paenibacillus uliginis N3/975]